LSLDLFIPSYLPATTVQQTQPPSQIAILFSNTGLGTIVDLSMTSTQADLVTFNTTTQTNFSLVGLQATSNSPVALSLNPIVGDIQGQSSTQIVSFEVLLLRC
jgi:hypothetical protein